ncbi:MAG TPA: hypothetical protein VIK03_06615 [Thermoleophilia bacterium]
MALALAVVVAGLAGYALGPGRRLIIVAALIAAVALVAQVTDVVSADPASVTLLPILVGVAALVGLALGACLRRAVVQRHRLT